MGEQQLARDLNITSPQGQMTHYNCSKKVLRESDRFLVNNTSYSHTISLNFFFICFACILRYRKRLRERLQDLVI